MMGIGILKADLPVTMLTARMTVSRITSMRMTATPTTAIKAWRTVGARAAGTRKTAFSNKCAQPAPRCMTPIHHAICSGGRGNASRCLHSFRSFHGMYRAFHVLFQTMASRTMACNTPGGKESENIQANNPRRSAVSNGSSSMMHGNSRRAGG